MVRKIQRAYTRKLTIWGRPLYQIYDDKCALITKQMSQIQEKLTDIALATFQKAVEQIHQAPQQIQHDDHPHPGPILMKFCSLIMTDSYVTNEKWLLIYINRCSNTPQFISSIKQILYEEMNGWHVTVQLQLQSIHKGTMPDEQFFCYLTHYRVISSWY